MDETTQEILCAVEQAVGRLLDCCTREGPLYRRGPRVVAHVCRAGKWLLGAIAALAELP